MINNMNKAKATALGLIEELATHGTVEVRALASAVLTLFEDDLNRYEYGYQFGSGTQGLVNIAVGSREEAEAEIEDSGVPVFKLVRRRNSGINGVELPWELVE